MLDKLAADIILFSSKIFFMSYILERILTHRLRSFIKIYCFIINAPVIPSCISHLASFFKFGPKYFSYWFCIFCYSLTPINLI